MTWPRACGFPDLTVRTIVAGQAVGQFDEVGLAQNDRPRRLEGRDGVGVLGRPEVLERADAQRRAKPGCEVAVLDPEGDAEQRGVQSLGAGLVGFARGRGRPARRG